MFHLKLKLPSYYLLKDSYEIRWIGGIELTMWPDLYQVATLGNSGFLIEVGRFIEVQYAFGGNDNPHDVIDSIAKCLLNSVQYNVGVDNYVKINVKIITTKQQVPFICPFAAV